MKFKTVKWSAENIAAFKSAVSFLIIGILWIAFSDRIASVLSRNRYAFEQIEIVKGWFFIFITSLLIFFLIKRYLSKANASISEKKAVEKHLDIFTKYVNDIILLIDFDGRIIEANDRALEAYGYTKDEILNLNIENLLVLDDNNRHANRRMKMIEQESAVFESIHKSKDGKIFPVEASTRTIDINGKIYFQSIIRDITERKKSEQALLESKLTLKELLELLPQNVFETDINGILTFGNLAGFEMFGYKPEDIKKNLSIFDMIVPEDRLRAQENIQKIFKGEKAASNEYTAVKTDGTKFPVLIFTNPIIRGGKPIGIRGILIDISERKKIEEQIRKLSSAVEQSASSIIITDIEGKIEYVNPKFTELTGYSLNEVKGKKPSILSSGETPKSEYTRLWNLILSGKAWNGEFLNKKKNGELYWESTSISPIKDEAGNITHFIAVKEDITSQKLLSQELVAAKEKAEESDRLKSEFLAQMSHEIRTPLNIILSYSSLLKEEVTDLDSSRYNSIFTSIANAGKRLLRTIDSILNMSSLQSGNLKINFAKVDVEDIIENLLNEFSNTAEQKGLKLSYNSSTKNTFVITDEYIASEILQNLIDNAIKYTEKGEIEIKLYHDDLNRLNIDVRDTGIGISQIYLPKLFHPFTQEVGGYSRKYEGNGLGLALVKNYADLINAEIKVHSQKGEGSIFTLIFNK